MDTEDFRNHPVGIGELRAERNRDAMDWTPREALIAALRDIDSGNRSPDTMVIFQVEKRPDGQNEFYNYCAGGESLDLFGLVEMGKMDMFARL